MDQRNVSSATEMAKLADLFYESNRNGNTKIDATRNFNSRGNQPFKPTNFPMPNVNAVNAVSGERKTGWETPKFGVFIVKCQITKDHKRSKCSRLQPRSNNCARVGLESERITGDQFVIPLYVNGEVVDGYRD